MSLSHTEIEHLVAEIRDQGVPAGVQKVFERDPDACVLQLRGRGQTTFVLVDTTPGATRMHLAEGKPKQPMQPTTFVMLLRKHLVGGVLLEVAASPDDRIVRLRFERRGAEEGVREERELVVELTGRHGNAFLLGEAQRVLGTQRRSGGERGLRPGATWEPPPPPPRLDTEDRWGLGARPVGERWEAVAAHYDEVGVESTAEDERIALRRELKAESRRLARLTKNIEGDLARAEEAQTFRRRGELLQSAYGMEIPRGAASVRVPDYWQDGAPLVEVALDPAKSLRDNVERYFHEYRRLSEATDRIENRLLEVLDHSERVAAARVELENLGDEELETFRERLREGKLLRNRPAQRRGGSQGPRLPYREFRAHNGVAILVGRGSKDNDALTTKVARGRDIWLHARDWPGSHVVLRMDKDGEPDGEALLDAALLAAHFSKGREDSLVDVTYTRAKHVRKAKGGAPGLVTVAGGSTIAVSPTPSRLQRLLDSEHGG